MTATQHPPQSRGERREKHFNPSAVSVPLRQKTVAFSCRNGCATGPWNTVPEPRLPRAGAGRRSPRYCLPSDCHDSRRRCRAGGKSPCRGAILMPLGVDSGAAPHAPMAHPMMHENIRGRNRDRGRSRYRNRAPGVDPDSDSDSDPGGWSIQSQFFGAGRRD